MNHGPRLPQSLTTKHYPEETNEVPHLSARPKQNQRCNRNTEVYTMLLLIYFNINMLRVNNPYLYMFSQSEADCCYEEQLSFCVFFEE